MQRYPTESLTPLLLLMVSFTLTVNGLELDVLVDWPPMGDSDELVIFQGYMQPEDRYHATSDSPVDIHPGIDISALDAMVGPDNNPLEIFAVHDGQYQQIYIGEPYHWQNHIILFIGDYGLTAIYGHVSIESDTGDPPPPKRTRPAPGRSFLFPRPLGTRYPFSV